MTVRAPGKVNLYLGVGEIQPDGYHELSTAFQALSLFEDVTASESDDFRITVEGDVDITGVPLDDTNLALRAAHVLAARAGVRTGVHLHIRKGVPVAGGMGGGSADAAAALVACDALWETALSPHELHELAAGLGADVPFSLLGGNAVGTGRGDELTPALARGRFDWVLVTDTRGMSTPAVYGHLDEIRDARRGDLPSVPLRPHVDDEILFALRSGDAERLGPALHNDLQEAAIAMRPDLGETLEAGLRAGALGGIVSGSGPTVALLCADGDAAARVHEALVAAGHAAIRATGAAQGAHRID